MEGFVTLCALKWFRSVFSLVLNEICKLKEGTYTLSTLIRIPIGVYLLVHCQLGLATEAFPTDITFERGLSCVHSVMNNETTLACEAFVTLFALKYLICITLLLQCIFRRRMGSGRFLWRGRFLWNGRFVFRFDILIFMHTLVQCEMN